MTTEENENEPEPEEEPEPEPEEEEQDEEPEEDAPTHTCGAKLEEGMKYCPACGDKLDTSAYE